jgi:methylenetetrahydrofolate dehydrogenase (NADP+)/methenyltetrahydrofolate cyclohydrolase
LLDGRAVANRIREALAPRVSALKSKRGRPPLLAIVTAEKPDKAAVRYRQSQKKACEEIGMHWSTLSADWRGADDLLRALAATRDCDGAILDLPLNKAVAIDELLAKLPPELDAEGVTPFNYGRLFEIKAYAELQRRRIVAPCTALAIAELLRSTGVPLPGKRAVVLGRSSIVGKPAAHLLSTLDMTVTLCHSKSEGLPELVGAADVVVAAMGKPRMVKAAWIKPGAVVIDAGVNDDGGKVCGDVEPEAAARAGFMTPPVGGLGPVTTAMLLSNSVMLAERRV